MNGKMTLPMAWGRRYTVFGGPYRKRPQEIGGHETFGVKMAEEIQADCHVDLPVRDFSVPAHWQVNAALPEVVRGVLSGSPVYIGCMGGIGRTGLMFALLAKAWGVENPVEYVREQYIPRAVETKQQQQFIAGYEIPQEVKDMIRFHWFLSWFRWGKDLTKGV